MCIVLQDITCICFRRRSSFVVLIFVFVEMCACAMCKWKEGKPKGFEQDLEVARRQVLNV